MTAPPPPLAMPSAAEAYRVATCPATDGAELMAWRLQLRLRAISLLLLLPWSAR